AGAHPAARWPTLVARNGRRRLADQGTLGFDRHAVLVLRIGSAVSHDLVTTSAERCNKLGTMVVTFGVEQHREGQAGFFEQFDQPPATNPVAILAPGPIIGIGMAEAR